MTKRPPPKSDQVSEAMRRMPEGSTGPEIEVRKSLFRMGLRFRIQYPVPGCPKRTIDIAFPKAKVAVFIDGCFWHGCSIHRNIPINNYDWWKIKIDGNRLRDSDTDNKLRKGGWVVLRYWEHDLVEHIAAEVLEVVKASRLSKERK